jgi:hypothetical protein
MLPSIMASKFTSAGPITGRMAIEKQIAALTKPAKPPPMAGRKQEVRQLRE